MPVCVSACVCIIVIQKHTGQRHVVLHAPSLSHCESTITQHSQKYKLCSFPLLVPMVTLRVNASEHPTETPLGRDASSAQLNNATPHHNPPQKHTTKYTYLTSVRGPYVFTGSATDLEISCKCIKAVRFHASTGKLHDDKPSSCSNTGTVTP